MEDCFCDLNGRAASEHLSFLIDLHLVKVFYNCSLSNEVGAYHIKVLQICKRSNSLISYVPFGSFTMCLSLDSNR